MKAPHVVALDRLLSLLRHEDFSGKDQSRERLRGDAMAGDGPFFTSTDTVEAAWSVGDGGWLNPGSRTGAVSAVVGTTT